MVLSVYDIARTLSDHQVKVIFLLFKGCFAVTNEGSSFKVWMETSEKKKVGFKVSKATLQRLYTLELVSLVNDTHFPYRYSLTVKGLKVLEKVPNSRLQPLVASLSIETLLGG